ncbi:WD40-repeat-containing domain protein [Cladochytrium replicatum]|nr:WD40-repeat-containing domain protein [Cladochytrium replicatum]
MSKLDFIKGQCVGVYKSHDGTVYSIDAHWKTGRPPPQPIKRKQKNARRIEPEKVGDDGVVTVVSGSHDQSIIVWEVQTGGLSVLPNSSGKRQPSEQLNVNVTQVTRLRGHSADVYCLEILPEPDKRLSGQLVSGGDYTLRLWNLETGANVLTLHGHQGYVACLRIRGKRAFSGSWDATVRSWNIEAGKGMHVFKGHKNIINCIDVTDTDIFSGSWDMTIIQWSRATGDPVYIYEGHTDGVQCLQVLEDELFSGSMDKTVRMWSIKTGRTVRIFRGHTGGVECLHVSESLCFSGSYDKTVRCFRIDTGDCVASFEGHTDGVYCVKLFEGILYTGSGDKTVRLWDARPLLKKPDIPWWERFFSCFDTE